MKKNLLFTVLASFVLTACGAPGNSNSPSSPQPGSTPVVSPSENPSSEPTQPSLPSQPSSEPMQPSSPSLPMENYFDVVVSGGTGSQSHVLEGTEVTVVANEPEEGYVFAGWKDEAGNVVSENATYTFEVTKNVTLTANYAKKKYQVTIEGGTGSGEYEHGAEVTAEAELTDGVEFVRWVNAEGEEVSTQNPFVFEATANVTYRAETKARFVAPQNFDAFKGMISKMATAQNDTSSVHYTLDNTKYTSTYSSEKQEVNATMYQNAVVIEGSETSYSTYSYHRILKLEGDYLKDVKKYESSYPTSKAISYHLVDEVVDEKKEMTREKANGMVASMNVIGELSSVVNDPELLQEVDAYTCELQEGDGKYHVSIKGHNETSTMYNVVQVEVVLDESYFVSQYSLTKKDYVKANALDENGQLKADATTKNNGYWTEVYTFVKGNKQEAPQDAVDVTPYFISSFEMTGRYYENNTTRNFSKESNAIWKGAEISISYIEMIEDSIQPATYLESEDLTFVSVSDPNVFEVVYNSSNKPMTLKAIGLGNATITMATSAGLEKTLDVVVKDALPPLSLDIDCADKVLVNEQIELNVKDLKPSSSDARVTWSVDNPSLATIVEEGGKTYLKGVAGGNVNVTVTSVADPSISASKAVFVSAGAMTQDQLKGVVEGKWLAGSSNESGAFIFEFHADGTITIVDNYRRATKITSTGNWTMSEELDSAQTHRGTNVSTNYADYLVIQVSNVVLDTQVENIASYLEIHFAIADDGSELIVHFAIDSLGNHQQFVLTKVA